MPGVDRNKKKSSTSGIMSVLEESAANSVTSDLSSLFKDNTLAKDVNEMLNLKDNATQFIKRSLIYPNPLNIPYMEGITESAFDALKSSIMEWGLMHNLVAIDDGKGQYRLISGEKRWTAISRMTEDEYNKALPNGVEVKILPYNPNLSETDEKIMLLTCNVLTFSSGSPDARQLRDLIKLYEAKGYERKDLVEFLTFYLKNNEKTMYKLIAEAHATSGLIKLLDDGILSRSALQHLGGLTVEEQEQAIQRIKDSGLEKIDETTALSLKKSIKNAESAKAVGTVSFLKLDKAVRSASSDIDKSLKINVEGMSNTEMKLSIANLNLMVNSINTLIAKLEEANDKSNKK